MNGYRLAFIIFLLLVGLTTVVYVVLHSTNDDGSGRFFSDPVQNKRFLTWFFFILGVSLLVGVGVYFLINRVDKKRVGDLKDIVKEPVPVDKAIDIYIQEFIKKTDIPFTLDYSVDGKNPRVVPSADCIIRHTNGNYFVDVRGQTSDSFYKFELFANMGSKSGLNVIVVCVDKGEDFIRNNIFWHLNEHTNLRSHNLNLVRYPSTSSLNEKDRLLSTYINLAEAGEATADDLANVNRFMELTKDTPVNVPENPNKEVINPRDWDDDSDVDSETDQTQKKIKKYLRSDKK